MVVSNICCCQYYCSSSGYYLIYFLELYYSSYCIVFWCLMTPVWSLAMQWLFIFELCTVREVIMILSPAAEHSHYGLLAMMRDMLSDLDQHLRHFQDMPCLSDNDCEQIGFQSSTARSQIQYKQLVINALHWIFCRAAFFVHINHIQIPSFNSYCFTSTVTFQLRERTSKKLIFINQKLDNTISAASKCGA